MIMLSFRLSLRIPEHRSLLYSGVEESSSFTLSTQTQNKKQKDFVFNFFSRIGDWTSCFEHQNFLHISLQKWLWVILV
jgi:hypothetical protein